MPFRLAGGGACRGRSAVRAAARRHHRWVTVAVRAPYGSALAGQGAADAGAGGARGMLSEACCKLLSASGEEWAGPESGRRPEHYRTSRGRLGRAVWWTLTPSPASVP